MKYVDYLRLERGWHKHPPPSAMFEVIARCLGWKPKPVASELDGDLETAKAEIAGGDEKIYGGDLSRFLTPEFKAKGSGVK